jgi:leucine-rich repeat protein SHOC2
VGLKSLSLTSLGKNTTLPAGLWQLNKLETLDLYDLNIDNISESIGQLSVLKSLSLTSLRITTLPVNLWRLSKLEELNLSLLNIKIIPEEIGQLPLLKSLYLQWMDNIKGVVDFLKNKGVQVKVTGVEKW